MLYDIGLRISYEYDRPANAGRHMLRLVPATLPGEQKVIASYLDIQPMVEERIDRMDFFGNATVEAAYRAPHEKIEFKLHCRVDRHVPERGFVSSPALQHLASQAAAYNTLDPAAPHHFAGRSPRVRPAAAMTAYASDLVQPDMPVFEAVQAITTALHRDISFDAEATTVDTAPEDAFAGKRGVCQDYSHIMIACLRGIGIPAGYVSGFLRTIPPAGKERLAGADAMHAWVRAWCGAQAGWVEFDPTNNLLVANDHIVIARGRDYSDVAPVKGVLRTAGSQTTEQSVDVVPLE
ncbi:MAG: transglutaminase family protein [Alphaproteobacteria bacterium]|nr:transglutaminase family protein [Alphaproteobacteria bacterium]